MEKGIWDFDDWCREFTFHWCHLPGSIILVNALVRRTPLSRPMFPRSRSRGNTQDRGQERFADDLSRRYRPRMHVAHERPTFWPNFEVITKRRSCRPVARPYCRSSLSLFALLASSRALLVRPSAVSAGRLSPVLVIPVFLAGQTQKSMRRNMRPDNRILRCTDRTFAHQPSLLRG